MTGDQLPFSRLHNGSCLSLSELGQLSPSEFFAALRQALGQGLRVASYFALKDPGSESGSPAAISLFIVLADDPRSLLLVGRTRIRDSSFESLAADFPQIQLFEREIHEDFGLYPEGHPWQKPVRRLPSAETEAQFYKVGGEQVHEVAVGPVHAGVIEPGHFRFQCHGERVLHLEIALGYQHRGIEKALIGGPDSRSLHYAETASGDASIAHAMAYCMNLEALMGRESPARAQAIGAIALELERLASHIGDLGALSGDTGFLPTASYCGRIRGDFLNMTALVCGNRFGRNLLRPGAVSHDLDPRRVLELSKRLKQGEREARQAVDLLFESQSALASMENTGKVDRQDAESLGAVGPAARASGLARDVRFDHSHGLYRLAQLPLSTAESGDALGRAMVRRLEIGRSIAFVQEQLACLPAGATELDPGFTLASPGLKPNSIAVSLVEAWRGELCHVAITDADGRFARYKLVDPSFHNWPMLAYSMRDQEISDFPLCNKSFNLSYCGHDL